MSTDVAKLAAAFAHMGNVLATIAAPRVHGAITDVPRFLAHAHESAVRLLGLLPTPHDQLDRFRVELTALRDRLDGADRFERSTVLAARACMAALGFAEPPEGWDAFTGEEEPAQELAIPDPITVLARVDVLEPRAVLLLAEEGPWLLDVAALQPRRADPMDALPPPGFVAAGPDGRRYTATEHSVTEISHDAVRSLELDHTIGIDVDVERGIVFVPPYERVVEIESFDRELARRVPVSHGGWRVRLSFDRRTLLISGSALDDDQAIALLDLTSFAETVLSIPGSDAVWCASDAILFQRGEHTLWRYRIGDAEPEKLFEIPTDYAPKGTTYGDGPVVSPDGRLCAWQWTIRTDGGARHGVVAIDLLRREYRTIGDQTNVFRISCWMP